MRNLAYGFFRGLSAGGAMAMLLNVSREKLINSLVFLALSLGVFYGFGGLFKSSMPLSAAPPTVAIVAPSNVPFPLPPELEGLDLNKQSDEEIKAKSAKCISCHENSKDPHCKTTVRIGCTDCHGGNPNFTRNVDGPGYPERPANTPRSCPAAPPAKKPGAWRNSANPVRS